MTPAQFLARMKKQEFAPAYLFLGPEAYARRQCRAALIEAALPSEDRENGLAQYDLAESDLSAVIDDARSLSLFAAGRVILADNAEAVLPRRLSDDSEDGDGAAGDSGTLGAYLTDPSPGVTIVFEAARFDFEGDEKKKQDRVRKFFSVIRDVVEFRALSSEDARAEAQLIAGKSGVTFEPGALDFLVEALGSDIARIAAEIEKLSLFKGGGNAVAEDDITALVPDARATTIFALVNALGRRDRTRSLEALDTLCRDGEYLPLALSFLSTQFRMALVSREAGLRSSSQVQSHFSRQGVPMWGSRAEQVYQTASKFSSDQLERALKTIHAADRNLRDARPDDRIVMEEFVFALTDRR